MKRIRNLIPVTLWLTVLLAAVSCGRQGAVSEKLDVAESLMNARPDSALAVLQGIPASAVKGKKASARYALLSSMALDKNCIDTTTFDILQPAIDYYTRNGTPDEQLRTYYYQGRIYQNQGDDAAAMRSFMKGRDLGKRVTDSLLLAHTLVAQGTLYLKQYKTDEFIQNNRAAAALYAAIGKDLLAIKSWTNALDGCVMRNDRSAADSLLSVCMALVQKNSDGGTYLFPSLLAYTVAFCSADEIRTFLDRYQGLELTRDERLNFAQGYTKIGEYDKAMKCLSEASTAGSILDSMKYASVKIRILEKQGRYEQALDLYRNYSALLERYQKGLLSQDLLFSDKRHQLEMENLMEIQERDRLIWGTLCSLFALVILAGWLYYQGHLSRTKRILTEKENENLRLAQDNLCKEKEKVELERNRKILETENLKLEIVRLESERDNLKALQRKQSELASPVKSVIKNRLDMLNGLLAKEITRNDSYAEQYNQWIEMARNDKKQFMNSTRLAFAASHPRFIEFLEQHGLTTDEINYLCLYAIGLRGKEVGEYIQVKRHYIMSHEIRMKLGLDEHETNIGLYIRRLMKSLE